MDSATLRCKNDVWTPGGWLAFLPLAPSLPLSLVRFWRLFRLPSFLPSFLPSSVVPSTFSVGGGGEMTHKELARNCPPLSDYGGETSYRTLDLGVP